MAKKPRPPQECYICGEVKPCEREHVFPKTLFPGDKPDNLITLPACKECNSGFSQDDEHFRDFIGGFAHQGAPEAVPLWLDAIKGFHRRPARLQDMFDRTLNIRVWTPQHGEAMAFTFQVERVTRVLHRIAAGLYRFHRGERLPSDAAFTHRYPLLAQSEMRGLNGTPWMYARTMGAIAYVGGVAHDDSRASMWYLNFFGQVYALVTTKPQEMVSPGGGEWPK